MNTGVISARYAAALVSYVLETGGGERVCSQVRRILADPEVLKKEELEPELRELVLLMARKGRADHLRFTLFSFVRKYYEATGCKYARLTTAVPDASFAARMKEYAQQKNGCPVELECVTDPSLIGGFTFEIDDYVLDGSVRSQLGKLRRELPRKHKRIV